MAEELALEEGLLEGGAVHGLEAAFGALAELVEGLGAEALAGPGLAQDQDRQVPGRDPVDHAVDPLHGERAADEEPELLAGVGVGAEALELVLGLRVRQGALEDELEVAELDGLGHEVDRAALDGLDGVLDGPEGRHDHDPDPGVELDQALEEV